MSFGFSVGDFLAVIELAKKIRKEFAGAPLQFKAITEDLSIVLQDVEVWLSEPELSSKQHAQLQEIADGCRSVLTDLEKTLQNYGELNPGSRNGLKRAWKRLKWEPEDIRDLRSRIVSNVMLLTNFQGGITNQVSLATKEAVVQLHTRQDNREEREERQTILDWLTPTDYAPQQNDFIARRQAGTGQWLLDSEEFHHWVEGDARILFCPGIPGAGKTMLTSIVVQELTTRFGDRSDIGVAYIYCNFRRQDKQKIEDLLASLLKQLADCRLLPQSVKDLYNRHKAKRTRPSLEEVSATLQSVAAKYSRLFIVVDALDECQSLNGCRQQLISELFNIQVGADANVFVTSRFIPEITEKFIGRSSLEIRASDPDIQRYLSGHMSELPGFVGRSVDLQDEIISEIVKAADGMFLLAQLHLDSLKGKRSPKTLRASLKTLATGSRAYDDAYNGAMDRIEGQLADQADLAKQALSWIVCARTTLTTIELQHALAVEVGTCDLDLENLPSIEDIVSACAGLVTVDGESEIIRLVHYTTQDYFQRTQHKWFPDVEIDMARICVTYLSFDAFGSGICTNIKQYEERLQSNRLYCYAPAHWGHHAREASVLIPEVMSFLEKQAQVDASAQALNGGKWSPLLPQSGHFHVKAFHLAALFGLTAVGQELFKKGADGTAVTDTGRQPLHLASHNGHVDFVNLLLTNGANLESTDSRRRTALLDASSNGKSEVVKLLLERGGNIESADISGRAPLHIASSNGHIDGVKLLLEKGVNIASVDDTGMTPLHLACSEGHIDIVKLLLEKGADISPAIPDGWIPLHLALNYGHFDIVNLLLEEGADIESASKSGTPLHVACSGGQLSMVKLLVANGADVESKENRWGQSPLSIAAGTNKGNESTVEFLLATPGVVPDSKDPVGRTPLSYAVINGNAAITQLLLSTSGVDVDSRDHYGSTPLTIASRLGDREVLELLLTRSPCLDPKDSFNRTPLWWARKTRQLEIVDILLRLYEENGIDTEDEDEEGRCPPENSTVRSDEESLANCDVCQSKILTQGIYYHCEICAHGDFDICNQCFAMDAHCLKGSHILVKRGD
ncbi:Ankyrin-1 [Lachnellula suecica]|uniref:Ankyrin-1 n=1 Tax=Lachnellula suecica TaxID=602035 RepID=A0A8T9CBV0_9HELO|nr:Ankyrin-1 [Lachnellula suecica]